MDQAPIEPSKRGRGGHTHAAGTRRHRPERGADRRAPVAPYPVCGDRAHRRVNQSNASRAFNKVLRRNADADIQTHHRSELAELEAEAAKLWTLIDAKDHAAGDRRGAQHHEPDSHAAGRDCWAWTRPRSSISGHSTERAAMTSRASAWRGRLSSRRYR